MNDRIVLPIGAVGTGKQSWNLPGGFQIAAITIDNPSGSWLFIKEDDTYVPPYTLGFGHNFHPTLTQVTVLFSDGPSGQVTTRQGDSVTLQIWSTQVGESLGTPAPGGYIENFTPVLVASVFDTANLGGTVSTLVAAVANKRIRLLSFSAVAYGGDISATTVGVAATNVLFGISSSVTFVGASFMIYYPQLSTGVQQLIIDFPVGEGLNCSYQAQWAFIQIEIDITYQLI